MPMSAEFENRLYPLIDDIAAHYGTPFHIYDEAGIHQTAALLKQSFAPAAGFREYFAVKALPNPRILAIMKDMGFGFDCSSVAELMLSRRIGARGEDIMFTSNNTAREDFLEAAREGGCILNLDDISLVPKVPEFPELVCFRYNPGPRRTGNAIIGNPVEAKYGVAHDQIVAAYRQAIGRGAKRFGIHTMLVSNERNHGYMVQTVEMLLELVEAISEALGIRFEFMNMGGGLGIPYRPTDEPLDITALSAEVAVRLGRFKTKHGQVPKLYMESGRYISGPHGVLVVRAINRKEIYRSYIGVDACMSALMRPAMYGAYHHITVPRKTEPEDGGPGGRRRLAVRKQRQVRHPARAAGDRRGRHSRHSRHRRPRALHGFQLQREAAPQGAAAAAGRFGGTDPEGGNTGGSFRDPGVRSGCPEDVTT